MSRPRGREGDPTVAHAQGARRWQRLLPWAVTLLCFAYLYGRLDRAAAAGGHRLLQGA